MLPLPYASPWNWLLYLLAALDVGLLAWGLLFGRLDAAGSGSLPRWLRLTLSAVLTLAALVGWRAGAHGSPAHGFARFIFLGMTLGFAGDLIMARVIPVPNRLVAGMLAFGLGHVQYILGLLDLAALSAAPALPMILTVYMGAFVLAVWAWATRVRKVGGSGVINGGSLVYALLMSVVVAQAILLAAVEPSYWTLALGALLFLGSDLTLGSWQVKGRFWRRINDVIWVLYVGGQMLIVYSVAAAVRVLSG